jgi:hypothetical protein
MMDVQDDDDIDALDEVIDRSETELPYLAVPGIGKWPTFILESGSPRKHVFMESNGEVWAHVNGHGKKYSKIPIVPLTTPRPDEARVSFDYGWEYISRHAFLFRGGIRRHHYLTLTGLEDALSMPADIIDERIDSFGIVPVSIFEARQLGSAWLRMQTSKLPTALLYNHEAVWQALHYPGLKKLQDDVYWLSRPGFSANPPGTYETLRAIDRTRKIGVEKLMAIASRLPDNHRITLNAFDTDMSCINGTRVELYHTSSVIEGLRYRRRLQHRHRASTTTS